MAERPTDIVPLINDQARKTVVITLADAGTLITDFRFLKLYLSQKRGHG